MILSYFKKADLTAFLYLALCAAQGVTPEKPYKGSFNVRIPPELHRQAAVFADAHHISLNKTVKNALTAYVYSH